MHVFKHVINFFYYTDVCRIWKKILLFLLIQSRTRSTNTPAISGLHFANGEASVLPCWRRAPQIATLRRSRRGTEARAAGCAPGSWQSGRLPSAPPGLSAGAPHLSRARLVGTASAGAVGRGLSPCCGLVVAPVPLVQPRELRWALGWGGSLCFLLMNGIKRLVNASGALGEISARL